MRQEEETLGEGRKEEGVKEELLFRNKRGSDGDGRQRRPGTRQAICRDLRILARENERLTGPAPQFGEPGWAGVGASRRTVDEIPGPTGPVGLDVSGPWEIFSLVPFENLLSIIISTIKKREFTTPSTK